MWKKRRENICNWFIMQLTKKKKKWLKGISGDIYFLIILYSGADLGFQARELKYKKKKIPYKYPYNSN